MPKKEKLELSLDDAVYLIEVAGKGISVTATVVTDINAFDQAAILGCKAVALENGWSADELYAEEVKMLRHPLIIEV